MRKKKENWNPLKQLNLFFSVKIWEPDLQTLKWYERFFLYLARLVYLVSRGFGKNQNLIRATALSYTAQISLKERSIITKRPTALTIRISEPTS
ncbi:hypothetical protein ACFLRA_03295, partial [Bdellovibrionota bacterium]